MEKKQFLNQNFYCQSYFNATFLQRVRFWIQNFQKLSDLEPTFYNSRIFEWKFFQIFRFWINFFTTTQTLNRILYKAWKFEVKLFLENKFCCKFASKKSTFSHSTPRKKIKAGIFVLSWKTWFWKRYFRKKNNFWIKIVDKNQLLNHVFYSVSDFESRSLKRVRLGSIFLEHSLDFILIYLQRVRFVVNFFSTR